MILYVAYIFVPPTFDIIEKVFFGVHFFIVHFQNDFLINEFLREKIKRKKSCKLITNLGRKNLWNDKKLFSFLLNCFKMFYLTCQKREQNSKSFQSINIQTSLNVLDQQKFLCTTLVFFSCVSNPEKENTYILSTNHFYMLECTSKRKKKYQR